MQLFRNSKLKLIIIDNFLKKEIFHLLSKTLRIKKVNKRFTSFYGTINNQGVIDTNFDPKIIKILHKFCHKKGVNILKKLNPKKLKLYEYSEYCAIITNKNSKSHIHDDVPEKLLSGVIYIYPNTNKGTFFYKNAKGEGKTEIKWKLNRAVFFSRHEDVSWHSYESDNNKRIVLVYNLMTSKVKEALEAEGKYYIFYYLRYLSKILLHKGKSLFYKFFHIK